ncbi:hypothetical protein BDV59DRAFT_121922 [Aspergillus ambiguus]|uniref:putative RNA binding protein n=1 Tax=Aspergillus ambiguus TaxID=176160 RepID=UPI003CCD5C10
MCFAPLSSDTSPMEIRTRRVIRRRFFGDGLEPTRYYCTQEPSALHPVRYRTPHTMAPPRLYTIEPRPQTRRRLSSLSLPPSPVRSRPLNLCVPFIGRVSRPADETGPHRSGGRGRLSRLFIVDPPRTIEVRSPGTTRRSPRIQSVSPRGRSTQDRRPEEEVHPVAHPQPSPRIRPPRERTPSIESDRPRRRRTVEVHNERSTSRGRQRNRTSPGMRQVRFAVDVEFNENRARHRSAGPETSPRRSGEADGSMCRDRHSPVRRPSPAVERIPAVGNARSNRLPPRIIQMGNREIARQGLSVFEEGRRRRRREGFLHSGLMPWNRQSARPRLSRSRSERVVYERDHRQRDGRWQ